MVARRADFAGSWYPGNRSDCEKVIEEFAETARPCPDNGSPRVGGIVPHAGWFFSGRTACNVVQCLRGSEEPDTVVLFGRHLHPGSRRYIMTEGEWETPLGNLQIDGDVASRLTLEFEFTVETATRYEQDNTIELQLPFIRYFFPRARIVPVGVPPDPESLEVGRRVVDIAVSMGRRLLVVGSTDLTHYGMNYGFSPKGSGEGAVDWVKKENDRRVIDRMLAMDAQGVLSEAMKSRNACCAGAAAAAIEAAGRMGASEGVELEYFTSYDIRPDTSFVGYVGVLF